MFDECETLLVIAGKLLVCQIWFNGLWLFHLFGESLFLASPLHNFTKLPYTMRLTVPSNKWCSWRSNNLGSLTMSPLQQAEISGEMGIRRRTASPFSRCFPQNTWEEDAVMHPVSLPSNRNHLEHKIIQNNPWFELKDRKIWTEQMFSVFFK